MSAANNDKDVIEKCTHRLVLNMVVKKYLVGAIRVLRIYLCHIYLQGNKHALGAFTNLRKATNTFVMRVCPSVRVEQLGSN